jgi:CRISPR-associated protein Cas2
LHWIQNSVFEGEITEVKLKELVSASRTILDDKDSLIIFKSRDNRWLEKEVHGNERNRVENIL